MSTTCPHALYGEGVPGQRMVFDTSVLTTAYNRLVNRILFLNMSCLKLGYSWLGPPGILGGILSRGPARGGSQVACRNFKMLRVGVLSRLTSLSEIKGQLLQFFVTNSRL